MSGPPPPPTIAMSLFKLRHLSLLLVVAACTGWFVYLRPTALGGPANYIWVSGTSMLPTLVSGDFVFLRESDAYATGDIVAYRVPEGDPGAGAFVIHRIVGGNAESGFVMQGDNKKAPDEWRPTIDDVLGRLTVSIPGVGAYLASVRNPTVFAPLAAGITVFLILLGGPRKPSARVATGSATQQ
jgi:signal peptidase I